MTEPAFYAVTCLACASDGESASTSRADVRLDEAGLVVRNLRIHGTGDARRIELPPFMRFEDAEAHAAFEAAALAAVDDFARSGRA